MVYGSMRVTMCLSRLALVPMVEEGLHSSNIGRMNLNLMTLSRLRLPRGLLGQEVSMRSVSER